MKKLLFSVFVLFLCMVMPQLAHAQSCLFNGDGAHGTGPLSPGDICITAYNYPYNGDMTKAQICASTPHPGDFLLQNYWEINGASSPDSDAYKYYDPTMSTSHCGVVGGLFPGGRGNNLISVASCGSGPGSGGSYGMNCKRADVNTSVAPWGNAQSNGIQLVTATPNSGTFDYQEYPAAAPHDFWVGHTTTLAMSAQWLAGASTPAYKIVKSLTVNGTPCGTPVNDRMSCGSTGVYVQYSSDNNEAPSPGQGNISGSYIVSSGNYANHYFCQSGAQCFKGPFNDNLLITPTLTGNYSVEACFQGTDSAQNDSGPERCMTYSFDVLAQPTLVPQPPQSFPPLPSMASFWAYLASHGQNLSQCGSTCEGVESAVQMITSELQNGTYFGGDNFSAGLTVGPLGLWNYDGPRVAYGVADETKELIANGPAWAPSTHYSQWTPISDGLNVEVATTDCVSNNGVEPSFPQVPSGTNNITLDGTCRWANAGGPDFWNSVAEREFDQLSDWMLYHDRYTTDAEYNEFTDGAQQHASRNYQMVGSSTRDTQAVEAMLVPFFNPDPSWDISNQRVQWSGFAPDTDTIRQRPYDIEAIYNCWLMGCFGSQGPVDNGVNELQLRIDSAIADLQRVYEYSPLDGVNFPIAGGMGSPNFDPGLSTEALIHACIVQEHEGQQCDSRIPVVVHKVLDWLQANQLNLTGNDWSMPYAMYTYPFGPQLCQSGCTIQQSDLNPLIISAYAWDGAFNGGENCTYSNGARCWDVADTLFAHAFDNTYGGSKEFGQLYKEWRDYKGYRTGTLAWNDSSILPAHNPYRGSLTPTIEPYPVVEWPAAPYGAVSGCNSTVTWYDTKPATSQLKLSLGGPGNYNLVFNGTANQQVSGSPNLYKNVVTATGLAQGQYYMDLCGTDAQGQTGCSDYDVLNNQRDFTFYIANGCSQQLQIEPVTPPTGEVGVSYRLTLVAQNGQPPYSWTETGALPAGLGLNSSTGVISGIPTAAGSSSFTVTVTDALQHTASANLVVTVVGDPRITTTSLPHAQQNQSYSTTLAKTGGIAPFTWSMSGSLPAGMSFTSFNGMIMGTPSVAGSFPLTFQVKDANGEMSAPVQLTLIVDSATQPLSIPPQTLPNGTVGASYDASLMATGGVMPYTWAIISGQLPAGLGMSSAGEIVGTPTQVGTSNFTVQVTDAQQHTATADLSITINSPVLPLQIAPISLPPGEVNVPYPATAFTATGGYPPYQFSLAAGSLPAGLTLNSDGSITGTPTSAGDPSFTVKVTDSHNQSATGMYAISVAAAPQISTQSLPQGQVGTPYSATLQVIGGTAPFTWSLVSGAHPALMPPGMTLDQAGDIGGTPTTAGSWTLTFEVTDANQQSAQANLTIVIGSVNNLTITTSSLPMALMKKAYVAQLAAKGGVVNPTPGQSPYKWSIIGSQLPPGMYFLPNGRLIGMPMAAGLYSITFEVTDSKGHYAHATLNLRVVAINDGLFPRL